VAEPDRDERSVRPALFDLRQPAPVALVEQLVAAPGEHEQPGQLGEVARAVDGAQMRDLARERSARVDRGR